MARAGGTALGVWLHGVQVATLSEPSRYLYRLEFTEESLDTYGEGARILSLSLPLSRRTVIDRDPRNSPVAAFLDGLLPEGNVRQHVARAAGVPTIDVMGLLRSVGAECAGAVQFLAAGRTPTDGQVRRLTPSEVDDLVRDLPTYHLPEGATPQASLAGIQDKVLLVAQPDGGWGWPEQGAISTHLIKPEPLGGAVVPHLVPSEHWAMTVATTAGLPAAQTRLADFGGREALVVTRYDRAPGGRRLHQEDFCQALALPPGAKYESTADTDGPRLRRLARLAAPRSPDPDRFRVDLLRAVTFNVVIGNADAHSKNYSILLGRQGQVSLAPLYDCAPVHYLDPRFRNPGHLVAGTSDIERLSPEDLVTEAASWGLSSARAADVVHDTVAAVGDAVVATPLPPGCEVVGDRLRDRWHRAGWRHRPA